jgi:hypothetical protein
MERDDEARRLRRAAVTRFGQAPPDPGPDASEPSGQTDEDDNAASQRMDQQALWAELQVRRAMERGDFDDLPGAGKPLDLPARHDPDWWVKRLIEREQLSGVAPPAIGLRREDAELDGLLDREGSEDGVRRVVADFNRRVVEARRQLQGGPPVITPLRDPDAAVEGWRSRRDERRERNRRLAAETADPAEASGSARRPLLRRLVLRRRPR